MKTEIIDKFREVNGCGGPKMAFDYINREFFNNRLTIDVQTDKKYLGTGRWGVPMAFYIHKISINDRKYTTNISEALEYLDTIYELIDIKRKIENI